MKTESSWKNRELTWDTRIKKIREADFFYTKIYCLGTESGILWNIFSKVVVLTGAFVPLWGRGSIFLRSRRDLFPQKSWFWDSISFVFGGYLKNVFKTEILIFDCFLKNLIFSLENHSKKGPNHSNHKNLDQIFCTGVCFAFQVEFLNSPFEELFMNIQKRSVEDANA